MNTLYTEIIIRRIRVTGYIHVNVLVPFFFGGERTCTLYTAVWSRSQVRRLEKNPQGHARDQQPQKIPSKTRGFFFSITRGGQNVSVAVVWPISIESDDPREGCGLRQGSGARL